MVVVVPRTLIAAGLALGAAAAAMAATAMAATAMAASAAAATAPAEWPPANLALLHSARFWEAHERGDLAQLALKKLVAARPDSPEALLELGELDLRINNFAEAAQVEGDLARRFHGSAAARELAVEFRVATRDRLKLASIRRLIEIGQTHDVRAALERLFPQGPPGASLGLDYYLLLAGTPNGEASAIEGVRRLAARHPDDPRYQLVLARLLLRQRDTQLEGVRLLERLAARDDLRAADVDSALAVGLSRMGVERAPASAVDAYLARHPDDTEVASLRTARQETIEERALTIPDQLAAAVPDLQRRLAHQLSGARGDAAAEARGWLERSTHSLAARQQLATAEQLAAAELRAALAFHRADYESEIAIAKELEAQGALQESGELLASAARLDPGSTWLFETEIRWLTSHGRVAQAIALLEGRHVNRKWTAADRDKLLAAAYAQRAAGESDAGRSDAAIADLEAAVRLSPADPWLRYRLAGIYRSAQEPERGRRIMSEGVRSAPGDADMRYAQGLYLSSLDDIDAAFAAVDGIAPTQRSAEMSALHDRLRVAMARTAARRLKGAGDLPGARAALLDVEPIAAHDIDRAAELAYSWIELGDPAHGLALIEPYVAKSPDSKTLLLYAHVLNSADDDARLGATLTRLRAGAAPLGETEQADVERLERSLDLRTARALARERKYAEAARRLDALLARSPDDRELRVARAELELDAGRPRAARDRLAALVAEDPEDLDTRLSYVRALTESGDPTLARTQLAAVEQRMPLTGEELHIDLARRQLGLGEPAKALRTLEPVLAASAPRPDVLMLAARAELAQRHLAKARDYFDRAAETGAGEEASAARREREALEQRLESSVSAGLMARHQPGSPGMSQIDALTIPSSWQIALDYESRLTAHADAVFLDSGHWTPGGSSSLLGTIPAASGTSVLRYANERESGLSPAIGYKTDSFAVDLGATPLGFLLTNVVGGIEWTPIWHGADLTLGVSRRAVTSSELSYAGLKDPITGTSWGAVTQNGPYAGLGVYRENYDVSGTVQLAEITGTRVLDNRFAGVRLSASVKFLSQQDLRADAGLTVNYWNYQHNLSNYTFGSAGYYSPQSYVSLATPVTLDGQRAGWVYRVRAAISYSVSELRTVAFFPDDAALEAAAARDGLPDAYTSPYFQGYHSSGFGFTAYTAAERRVASWLVAGFMIDIDRTDYYHPTTVEIYLRHAFGGRASRTIAPPSPVYPYNR